MRRTRRVLILKIEKRRKLRTRPLSLNIGKSSGLFFFFVLFKILFGLQETDRK
ncbi:hypothetical protein TorRG33x02_284940 [Trema orientale]|uniref:Uncharacterized protein n=1 Tax=Trema orientale TaxID=63057 RepID=A0A2P5CGU8_TREOI|nr:hypothetical protein TorRG33x02_284940 [Trema orientale]